MKIQSKFLILLILLFGLSTFQCNKKSNSNNENPAPGASGFSVGGSVTGLNGTLVLQNNGADDLTISADGAFTFSAGIETGGAYNVTVSSQPGGQTCSVTNGAGTISSANMTTVIVSCHNDGVFTLGGNVSELSGTLVVQNNGGDNLSLTTDGSFTFSSGLNAGNAYNVSVLTQPANQNCSITNGSGTISSGNITNIIISCTASGGTTYTIGGTVSGLTGTVVLQNNLADDLSISANGVFSFATGISNSAAYSVTISSQPTDQICSVTSGSGTMGTANVTSVNVTCVTNSVPTHTVGGTTSGLVGTVVLQNNSGDNLTIDSNGSFTFGTAIDEGVAYNVTVLTPPTGQTCSVSNGSGTIASEDVTNVTLTCTMNSYTVGGNVNGLSSGTIVLQNNSGDNLSIDATGAFTFVTSVDYGNPYSVTILTPPTGQNCYLMNVSGTMAAANVTTVIVNCMSDSLFSVGGSVTGLVGAIAIQNNLTDNITLISDGNFTFVTGLADFAAYNVTILTEPTGQTCAVNNGSGNIAADHVTNVIISCTTNAYTVGGNVSGLTGTVVLQNNGGDDLSISSNGSFTFMTSVNYNNPYIVAVSTPPAGQTCNVTNGSGTMGTANVTNVTVSCTTNTYTVGGNISGLAGTVVLQNNVGDDLSISSNGSFTFATGVDFGALYDVTVLTHPAGQFCSVTNASGTMTAANVTNVNITCAAATYTIGGNVSGLSGTVVLRNNGGDDLTINADGPFTFASSIPNGGGYDASVLTQPAGQVCNITNGTGTVSAVDVTSLIVSCVADTLYTVGGTANGLSGTVVIQNNAGDDLAISSNGSFTFPTGLAASSDYNVTVLTQPAGQICTPLQNSGTIFENVTYIYIACSTPAPLTLGAWTPGTLATGEVQWFYIDATSGSDYYIGWDHAWEGTGTYTGVVSISCYQADQVTPYFENDTSGFNYESQVTAVGTERIYIKVQENWITSSGTYGLRIGPSGDYTLGGTVNGLTGTVVLQNNFGDDLSISSDGPFTFATPMTSGSNYYVTVSTQSASQICSVTPQGGTMGGGDMSSINVTCVTPTAITLSNWTIVSVNTDEVQWFYFDATEGQAYKIQWDDFWDGSGAYTADVMVSSFRADGVTPYFQYINSGFSSPQTIIASANEEVYIRVDVWNTGTFAVMAETTTLYTIGGTASGLTGTVQLWDNNTGESLSVSANGAFSFASLRGEGANYNVSVWTQPSGQTCNVTNGSGTMPAGDVTDIIVSCIDNTLNLGGTVSELTGTVQLGDNSTGESLSVSANGAFAFASLRGEGANYNVSVWTQPSGQTCSVTNGASVMPAGDVTNLIVSCIDNSLFSVGGTMKGATGTVVLQNNGGDDISIDSNGGFTFATGLADTAAYDVTIFSSPAGQSCQVTNNASGNIASAHVTDVVVLCSTALTNNTWSVVSTLDSPEDEIWFFFDATVDQTYNIQWDDFWGTGTYTADVDVFAYREDKVTSYFEWEYNGYDTPRSITAVATERIYIRVSPYSLGTFSIRYY